MQIGDGMIMCPIVYVPIGLGNPTRNEAQLQLIEKLKEQNWYPTGSLQFKNGHETTIEVVIMTKQERGLE
jgi:hypothetical protein